MGLDPNPLKSFTHPLKIEWRPPGPRALLFPLGLLPLAVLLLLCKALPLLLLELSFAVRTLARLLFVLGLLLLIRFCCSRPGLPSSTGSVLERIQAMLD